MTKSSIERGAFYAAPGMRQAPKNVLPLLADGAACDELFDWTMDFLAKHP